MISGVSFGSTFRITLTGPGMRKSKKTRLKAFADKYPNVKYPNGNKVSSEPKMLFARKDMEEVLKLTAEITRKQKAEFIESQTKAAENLEKAGRAQDAEKIRSELREQAEAKLDEAAELIVERIVNG